jgi:hypothetical protein
MVPLLVLDAPVLPRTKSRGKYVEPREDLTRGPSDRESVSLTGSRPRDSRFGRPRVLNHQPPMSISTAAGLGDRETQLRAIPRPGRSPAARAG